MKNSKEYAEKIKKLHRSLKRNAKKVTPVTYDDPVEAIIYGILSEKVTERQAHTAWKRFKKHFVDLNDLRVARPDEIYDLFGKETEEIRNIGLVLAKVLFSVFDKHHEMTLAPLHDMGKRQARQELEELNGMPRYALGYCMLTGLDAHAIPVTDRMVQYLQAHELVDPKADVATIEGFLAKQVAAKDTMEFHALLRQESESASARKVMAKKSGTKKAAKKTVTKKKAAEKKVTTKKAATKKAAKKTVTKKKTTKKVAKKAKKKKSKA
jgi:endonuclease III